MTTKTNKQIELLTGLQSLGLFTNKEKTISKFRASYSDELLLAEQVKDGMASLTEQGEETINTVWSRLLKDHLAVQDFGFEDMNDFVVAIHNQVAGRKASSH